MSLATLIDRYGRAIALTVALAAAAGLVAGMGLPSSIYPRLEFPRVVIIGHSGTLPAQMMMLSVTRPLEQAVMEVPGIRRVRSKTFRGATEISAQFEPSVDMVVASQQVQGKIDDARQVLPAGTDLVVERLTPAAFPMYILNLSGSLPAADLFDPGYFRTLGISLIAGRQFTVADRAGSQRVAIVSRRLADRFFPGEDPLDRTIALGGKVMQIVGIAADIRSQALTATADPELYVPHAQTTTPSLTFVVKSRQAPAQVLADARSIVQAIDPQVPLIFPESMQQVLDRALARPRFYLVLLGLFALLAIVLAAVGVYGVVAYAVSQRTREIGVRIALGARRTAVVRLMLWQGLRPASLGLAVGLVVAFATGRVIEDQLYGVRAHDPWTFGAVTALLLAVVVAACAIPATRASRVPPAAALRGD